MAVLRIKIGNPVIRTETDAGDVSNFHALDEQSKVCTNVEEIILNVDMLQIRTLGKLKSTKYPDDVTFFWVKTKIQNAEDGVTLTAKQIETERLKDLAKKNGLI